MMLMRISRAGVWAGLTVTADVVSWRAVVATFAVLIVCGVLQLLGEWQRRQTFKVLVTGAPEGTVVIQHDTLEGQLMQVSLGSPPSRRSAARS